MLPSYVLNSVKAAKVDGLEQRIVYCSVRVTSLFTVFELTRVHSPWAQTPALLSFTPSMCSRTVECERARQAY